MAGIPKSSLAAWEGMSDKSQEILETMRKGIVTVVLTGVIADVTAVMAGIT